MATGDNVSSYIRGFISPVPQLDALPEMIDITTILFLSIAALAIWAVVDFTTIGSAISRHFYRRVRAKTLGAIEIDTLPDLGVAAANGLLGVR